MTDHELFLDGADNLGLEDDAETPDPARPSDPPSAFRQPSAGARSLTRMRVSVGWGLAVLGVLAGISVLLEPAATDLPRLAVPGVRWLRAVWSVVAFGLAGWTASELLNLISTYMDELRERESRRSSDFAGAIDRASRQLERIAARLEQWGERGGQQLERTREPALGDRIAELKAAREVNDPARVLELYEAIAPEVEPEQRGALQSEVAAWFLTAIYRRLRTGTIQIEVVELATRFAGIFASTAQGASVQAALPTLRRGAGLCPKCAQPYTGVAKACPQCLRQGARSPAGPSPPDEDSLTEPTGQESPKAETHGTINREEPKLPL